MINSRTTPFDTYTTIAVSTLKCALNDGSDRDIPVSYISKFCDMVMNSMWRCVFNTIAGSELYGDADGFIFNMGGYIDAFYDCDDKRWQGFTDGQVELTAEEIYDIFLSQARKLMHYKEKEE